MGSSGARLPDWGLPVQADNIPADLKKLDCWLSWQAIDESDDKVAKWPFGRSGRKGWKYPENFLTFDEALQKYEMERDNGIGFAQLKKNNLVFIDVDNCFERDQLKPCAEPLIELTGYVERSPSGKGLRIVGKYTEGIRKNDVCNKPLGYGASIEVYFGGEAEANRFLTLTGAIYRGLNTLTEINVGKFRALVEPLQSKTIATLQTSCPPLLTPKKVIEELPLNRLSQRVISGDYRPLIGERSSALFSIVMSTLEHLPPIEAFYALAYNDNVRSIAEEKRGDNAERGLEFLWQEVNRCKHLGVDKVTTPLPARYFNFVLAADLVSNAKAPKWLIKGFLEEGILCLLFGDPGAGKSLLALHWGLCVATGQAWNSHKVKAGIVIILAAEGQSGTGLRLHALSIVEELKLNNYPLYISHQIAQLCNEESAKELSSAIEQLAEKHGAPKLVIIDTLARHFGGDENSTQDMNKFIAHITTHVQQKFGTAILIVHHSGHADKTRARGAMALKAAVDTEFRLTKKETTSRVEMHCTKLKDGAPPEESVFKFLPVPLPIFDEDGEQCVSPVLELTDEKTSPVRRKKPKGTNQLRAYEVLKSLDQKLNDEDFGSMPRKPVADLDWRQQLREDGMDRRRIDEGIEGLEKNGYIERKNENVTLTQA